MFFNFYKFITHKEPRLGGYHEHGPTELRWMLGTNITSFVYILGYGFFLH